MDYPGSNIWRVIWRILLLLCSQKTRRKKMLIRRVARFLHWQQRASKKMCLSKSKEEGEQMGTATISGTFAPVCQSLFCLQPFVGSFMWASFLRSGYRLNYSLDGKIIGIGKCAQKPLLWTYIERFIHKIMGTKERTWTSHGLEWIQ